MANRRKKHPVWRWILLLLVLAACYTHRAQIVSFLRDRTDLSVESAKHAETADEPEEEASDGVAYSAIPDTEEEVQDGYYYRKLEEDEQTLYKEILRGVRDGERVIAVGETDTEVVGKVYQFLLYDRPELFWCTGEMTITSYVFSAELEPVYTWTGAELEKRQQKLEAAVERCLSGITTDASDYQRVKYVFRYLVDTVDYDLSAENNQTLYSALVGGKSVCAGYSKAAQYLLQKLGIPCIYVTGTAEGGDHAWNIVKCNGKYYQMDVTFGDPTFAGAKNTPSNINYAYLCCTDEDLYRNHTPSDIVELPECNAEDLDYYVLHDRYYSAYDRDAILHEMNQSIEEREESFDCKFATKQLFQEARDDLVENLLPQAARNLAGWYGLSSGRYSYVVDDTFYTITVYWEYEN